jgi:hypothetical protein
LAGQAPAEIFGPPAELRIGLRLLGYLPQEVSLQRLL